MSCRPEETQKFKTIVNAICCSLQTNGKAVIAEDNSYITH